MTVKQNQVVFGRTARAARSHVAIKGRVVEIGCLTPSISSSRGGPGGAGENCSAICVNHLGLGALSLLPQRPGPLDSLALKCFICSFFLKGDSSSQGDVLKYDTVCI